MEEKAKLGKVMEDAKALLELLTKMKEKVEINSTCVFFKYIDRTTLARAIVPYLDMKDIINFRVTCKDINATILSTVSMVSYYRAVNKKTKNNSLGNFMLKSFDELKDAVDIQTELDNISKIRDLLSLKAYPHEKIIKLYKNDMDTLKKELKAQNEMTTTLTQTLSHDREEFEEAKKINIQKQKIEDTDKQNDDMRHKNMTTEELSKQVESLKIEKSTLTNGVMKLKKIIEELKKKNSEKSETLKAMKTFFMTSTLFKLKSIGLEDNEELMQDDSLTKK